LKLNGPIDGDEEEGLEVDAGRFAVGFDFPIGGRRRRERGSRLRVRQKELDRNALTGVGGELAARKSLRVAVEFEGNDFRAAIIARATSDVPLLNAAKGER